MKPILRPLAVALSLAVALPALAAPDAGTRTSDLFREGQLWATYAMDPSLSAYPIDVDVAHGVATLRGRVESAIDRDLAGEIARGVRGIRRVDNQLQVDPQVASVPPDRDVSAYHQHVGDAATAARIRSLLSWNEYTTGLDIKVGADDGIVTLSGLAPTRKSRTLAGELAAGTAGVREVRNQLELDPKIDGEVIVASDGDRQLGDQWIASRVWSMFEYSASVDADRIDVRSVGGRVTLSGQVGSEAQRARAIELAQGVRGVREVDARDLSVAAPVFG